MSNLSGGSQSGSGNAYPIVPGYLRGLAKSSAKDWRSFLGEASPQLAGLLNPNPEQIAPLTSGENQDIASIQNTASGSPTTPEEAQALALLNQSTSGAIGTDPATQAAFRAFNQNVAPTISSSIADTGGGRGGALAAALSQAQGNAAAPLLAGDVANRTNAAGEYANIGNTVAGRQMQNLQTALSASGLPREIQQSIYEAQYNDFLRRQGLIQQATMGPISQFGNSLIGQQNQQQQTSTTGLFGK